MIVLTALLAALHAKRNLPGVSRFGKFRDGSFQALELTNRLKRNEQS